MFREREIYWASIGKNIVYEQNGKSDNFSRPVLILKKFSRNSFLGIPLTTKNKNDKFHFKFSFKEDELSWAYLSQIRLFDMKRLNKKIGKINIDDFKKLENKLKELLFPLKS